MKNKLVMTLLVRDEEDILEQNICHHLNQGVDFIVAIDNGSTDSTVQILEKYQRKKVLSYSIINKYTKEQDVWVSQMAKEAVDKFGATHLFHCDADEFWLPTNSDLKDQLDLIKDVAFVRLINYIPPMRGVSQFSFDNFHYIVSNPIPYTKPPHKSDSSKVLIYEYPKKIMTTKKFINIDFGNHLVKYAGKYQTQQMSNIFIHHFSIRSYRNFQKKVVNTGNSLLKNPLKMKNPDTSWQYKRWFTLYLEKKLEEEYDKISLKKTFKKYLKNKIIKKSSVPIKIKNARIIYLLSEMGHKFQKFI